MQYVLTALMGYLLGCSNMAYFLSRIKNVDFRSKGSCNLGASNTAVLLGWGPAVLVAGHDIGKALLAVLLAKLCFPSVEYAAAVAGAACVLGHIFPFYLKFKGGKGLASFLGAVAALNWKVGLAVVMLLVLVTVLTDFIALGTLGVTAAAPVGLWFLSGSVMIPLIVCIASVVIAVKHFENVRRILNRTEIGLRSVAKGENKV